MLGNYLQQTTSADNIFRCIFSWRLKGLMNGLRNMRGSRKLGQMGSNLSNGFFFGFFLFLFCFVFCFFDEGRNDPNTTINGPSTARQRNVI